MTEMELIGAITPPKCPSCEGKLVGQVIDRDDGQHGGPPDYWTCPHCGYVEDRYGFCTGRDKLEKEIRDRHAEMTKREIDELRAIP